MNSIKQTNLLNIFMQSCIKFVRQLSIPLNKSIRLIVGLFGALIILSVVSQTYAQSILDTSFDPNINGQVDALEVQVSGKIFVGGLFSSVGGQTRNNLARLNADGTPDTAFNMNVDFIVEAIESQTDGKILIGGGFNSVGGQTRYKIARLNTDGSLDTSFNPSFIQGNHVAAIAVQADGKILIGGQFSEVGIQTRNKIARLNPDGSLDSSFNPDASDGLEIKTLAIQPDGKILIGGDFSSVGGQVRNSIARLNTGGSLDLSFNANVGSNTFDRVYAIKIQADSKILIGGEFTSVGGQVRNRIARLNIDGTPDAFDANIDINTVTAIEIQTNGKILVVGGFSSVGGQTRHSVARLNTDGTPDAFNPDAGNNYVNAIAIQSDGKVLIGGSFSTVSGQPRNRIARLNAEEPLLKADYQFQGNLNSSVAGAPAMTNLTGSGGANSFQSNTIDGYTQQSVRFPFNSGLAVNTNGVIPNNAYTIVMLIRFDNLTGFRRVASFDNGTTDNGAYIQDARFEGEPTTNNSFLFPNIYFQATIVREASGRVRAYRDGVLKVDVPNDGGAFAISSNVLRFFQDDSQAPNEASAGNVARIRLYDAPMTDAQVRAIDRVANANGGGDQSIVFYSFRDGNSEIYTMNVNGSNQLRLTNNSFADDFPTWSPNRQKIVFRSNRDGNSEIYTMNPDGSNALRLTNNALTDYYPAYSPDGSKILFSRCELTGQGICDIWLMNNDGTNQINLTNNPADDDYGRWSPDGTKIVFGTWRDNGTTHEIYTMNADGSNPVRLTNNTFSDIYPAWSPNGAKIAFQSNRDGNDEIYTMNLDGSSQTRLTNTASNVPDRNPIWSPDSLKIAFLSFRDSNGAFSEIHTMNSDGSAVTRLTFNNQADVAGDWRGQSPANCASAPSGMIAWYKGENDANDSVGSRNGTLTNGTTFAAGKVGQAFSFDGTNDYIQLPGSWGGSAELTISAWVKTTASPSFQAIVSSTDLSFVHFQLAPAAIHHMAVYSNNGEFFLNTVGNAPEFQHVVLSVKSGETKFYINGNVYSTNSHQFTQILSTANVRIGNGLFDFGGRHFNGLIDEVQIYDRALSQAEVQNIYNADSAGVCQACQTIPISYGQTYSGALTTNSCVTSNRYNDTYSFSGSVGDQIAITMDAAFFPALELINSSGAVIQTVGGGDHTKNIRLPDNQSYFTLTASGTYTIRASSNFQGTGAYSVSLYKAPPAATPCTYSLSSPQTNVPSGGGTFAIDVLTQAGCPPTAAPSLVGQIYSVISYIGGRLTFSVRPNTGATTLQDTITVAGLTHTIFQYANVAPTNNPFAGALMISGISNPANAPVTSYNTNATAEASEPAHAGNPAAKSVWYKWTAPEGGLYSFSTSGSSFDTVMAIYECPATGVCSLSNITIPAVGSNDDTTSFDKTSKVNFRASIGRTYYIAIDGKNGASGTTQLSWLQYERLYRLYLQTYNGNPSPLTPIVTAANGSGNVDPSRITRISQGVYEFNLPADNTVYFVNLTGPSGIVWNPNNFPLDTSFSTLSELMEGPAAGNQNFVSNAENQTPRYIFGSVKNITQQELSSLSIKLGFSSGSSANNPHDPVDCNTPETPLTSTTISSVAYAKYQCKTYPQTFHDILPSMVGKGFVVPVKSFDHYINDDYIDPLTKAIVASNIPTFNIGGLVLGGGEGTDVTLTYLPTPNATTAITLKTKTTNANGAYEFKNLVPNKYNLKATRTGFVFNQPPEINLAATINNADISVQTACTYEPEGLSTIAPGGGNNIQFAIKTNHPTCEWSATSSTAWITVNPVSWVGNGNIHFTAKANPDGLARTGIIKVGSRDISITQAGVAAPVSVAGFTPATATTVDPEFDLRINGFNFVDGAKVQWNNGPERPSTFVSANQIIVRITITDIAAPGVIPVKVINPANAGGGTVTSNFTVNCGYLLSPATQTSFTSTSGSGSFNVTTAPGCSRTAEATDYCMISNLSGGDTGSGTVNFSVAENRGVARTAVITVGGKTVTVNQAAATGTHHTRFDYDGDGKADLSVYRPDAGIWYLFNRANNSFTPEQFGLPTDKIAPADYDGDGKTDVAVFRPSNGVWYVLNSSNRSNTSVKFGLEDDIPVPADFDGDGKAELVIYRPSNGTWYVRNLVNNQESQLTFGSAEDKPLVADYDGDGKADYAVWRPSNGTWYVMQSTNQVVMQIPFGISTDKPMAADYNGDDKADLMIYRNGFWHILINQTDYRVFNFGSPDDVPVPADYNGDGKADIAVFRPSNRVWYLWSCTNNSPYDSIQFGLSSDRPTPNVPVP